MLAARRYALLLIAALLMLAVGCPPLSGRGGGDDDDDANDDDSAGDDDDATGDDDDATGDDDDATPPLSWTTLWATSKSATGDPSAVQLITLDPVNGAELSRMALGGDAAEAGGTNGLAWAPDQSALYVVTRGSSKKGGGVRTLGTVDTATGAVTNIGELGDAVADIAFGPDGTLYAVTGQLGDGPRLFSVDTSTGALTQIGSPLINDQASRDGEALAFDPGTNMLYRMSGNDPYDFYSVDPATAAETAITLSGVAERSEATAMTHDPNSGLIHWVDRDQQLYSVDTAGVQALVGPAAIDKTFAKGLSWGP